MASGVEIHPLTAERWSDLEQLFGPNGACAGCWCMYWRRPRAEFSRGQGEGNRLALQALASAEPAPGLLAYARPNDRGHSSPDSPLQPAGWISLGPRPGFPPLYRSPLVKPLDPDCAADPSIWSVVCFYIGRKFRRQGLALTLLQAAVEYARQHGARLVEGYPFVPASGKANTLSIYTGVPSVFEQAGFSLVGERKPNRPIYRLVLSD